MSAVCSHVNTFLTYVNANIRNIVFTFSQVLSDIQANRETILYFTFWLHNLHYMTLAQARKGFRYIEKRYYLITLPLFNMNMSV